MKLFNDKTLNEEKDAPLAYRMAPRTFDEFVGQEHILGEGKLLRRAIEADRTTSLILYGPPGTGKTALARIIANKTQSNFIWLNAATAKLEDLRDAITTAKKEKKAFNKKTIIFLDEIHRFNKLQQDALLPDVEEGNVILIGATVENPFFYVVSALVSRSQIFELKSLSKDDLKTIIKNALTDERGLKSYNVTIDEDALEQLAILSEGDARRALSSLEIGVLTTPKDSKGKIHFTLKVAEESIQKKAVVYRKDEHYDIVSAFIKSMRGSDPDAALYYLAKMIYAGEDPRFIARRIVICAAEDVGNADPQALILANAALQVSEFVGLPEAQIPLAQAVTYIATAPKSNSAYLGIAKAMKDVESGEAMPVPEHLKDANYPGAKKLGHGIGYKYAHDFPEGFVPQQYLSKQKKYYEPKMIGFEATIKERMEKLLKRVEKENKQKYTA